MLFKRFWFFYFCLHLQINKTTLDHYQVSIGNSEVVWRIQIVPEFKSKKIVENLKKINNIISNKLLLITDWQQKYFAVAIEIFLDTYTFNTKPTGT
jgi:hypothetical protein